MLYFLLSKRLKESIGCSSKLLFIGPPKEKGLSVRRTYFSRITFNIQGSDSIDILGSKLGTKLGTILERVSEHIPISCPVSCPISNPDILNKLTLMLGGRGVIEDLEAQEGLSDNFA